MSSISDHIDPENGFIKAIAKAVVDEQEERERQQPTVNLEDVAPGIELMKPYSAREVAQMLGSNRVESVYSIPEAELPRVRRIGSRHGYLGIHVLCYLVGTEPIDMEAVLERYREKLMEEPGKILSLNSTAPGLKRVL